jgi:hypothetical protein
MIARRSAEQWLAEVEEVVRRYRLACADPRSCGKQGAAELLTQALAQLRRLGLTQGEGLRLLRGGGAPEAVPR